MRQLFWAFGILLLLALTACRAAPARTSLPPPPEVSALPAASEFLVGENRFPFGLVTISGELIEGDQVRASFYRLHPDGRAELKAEANAVFREIKGFTPHRHEGGEIHLHEEARGVYLVDRVSFDRPGFWLARFQISGVKGAGPGEATLAFEVKELSATLRVGDRVPASRNPTARDVRDLREITTHYPPVTGLYQFTVVEALEQARPFVVVFSTPAFCVSRMCGPVTDVVAQLYERHKAQASFIHIEPWRLDIARNEGRLVWTQVAEEWRLPSEPWVFVVDRNGRLAARFEGLVTAEEIEAALREALAR